MHFPAAVSEKSRWLSLTSGQSRKAMPFRLSEIGVFYAGEGYGIKRAFHDSFLFLYTLKGEGEVQTEDKSLRLSAGHFLGIDCRLPHAYHTAGKRWDFCWFHFNGPQTGALFELLYPEGPVPLAAEDPLLCEKYLRDLLRAASGGTLQDDAEMSLGIHALYAEALKASVPGRKEASAADASVRKVLERIRSSYSRPIGIDDLIRDVPMSKYHFIRVFKRVTGLTPYNYLILYRINKAKEYLRSTELQVSEIALCCGYADLSNFTRQFKKHTKLSPLAYRKAFSEA